MLIPPRILGISKLCDPESSRYALGGVRLERDKDGTPHAVVTDGRRILAVTWQEDKAQDYPSIGLDPSPKPGFETIIPKKVCEEAAKLPPRKTGKPILANVVIDETESNGKVHLGATDLETDRKISPKSLEGKFPRWRDHFQDYQPHESTTMSVDCRMLAEILTVIQKSLLGDDQTKINLAVPHNPRRAIIITSRDHEGVESQAVLAPCFTDDKKPDFTTRDIFLAADKSSEHEVLEALVEIATPAQRQAVIDLITSRYTEPKTDESAPEPVVEPDSMLHTPTPESALKLVADSIDRLRQCDVFRMLESLEGDNRQTMAKFIIENRPDVTDRVNATMAGLSR